MSSAASMLLRVSSTRSGVVDSADIVKPVSRRRGWAATLRRPTVRIWTPRPLLPQPSERTGYLVRRYRSGRGPSTSVGEIQSAALRDEEQVGRLRRLPLAGRASP